MSFAGLLITPVQCARCNPSSILHLPQGSPWRIGRPESCRCTCNSPGRMPWPSARGQAGATAASSTASCCSSPVEVSRMGHVASMSPSQLDGTRLFTKLRATFSFVTSLHLPLAPSLSLSVPLACVSHMSPPSPFIPLLFPWYTWHRCLEVPTCVSPLTELRPYNQSHVCSAVLSRNSLLSLYQSLKISSQGDSEMNKFIKLTKGRLHVQFFLTSPKSYSSVVAKHPFKYTHCRL